MHARPHRHLKARAARYASVLTRQRQFAARFFGARRSAQEITALTRMLRRSLFVMHQHGAPLHLSLHALLRSAGPAPAPRGVPPALGRIVMVRERLMREHRHVLRHSQRTSSVERPNAVQSQAPPARMVVTHRIERQPSLPPLALTMVRSSATAALAAVATPNGLAPASALPRSARASDGTRSAVASPLVLPQPELARVTEHVIQQLDRRVLSYRERTGQV